MPSIEETPRDWVASNVDAAGAAFYGGTPAAGRGPVERLRRLLETAVPRGAVILGVLALVNAGSGFVVRKVVGHIFGAGPETDAFWNAASLTQFPVDLLITGGIIGPFLPLFLGLKGEAEASARDFARTILTSALIAMAVALAFLLVFAPQIASIAAPGFTGSQRDLYIGLIRVICLGQLAITASLVLGEVLIAERRFLSYGLAEFALNVGTAAGALILGGVFGLGIYGAAVGFLLGAAGHLSVRLAGVYRTTFRPRPSLALRTKGVAEFSLLMLPKMASQGLLALLLLYFNQIASTLAPGSTSSVAYARDFQSTAESMVGLSFALAAFPALSVAAAAGDGRGFRRIFRINILTIGFFSTLAAAALIVSASFISGLFKGGAFDDTDASRMTLVLVVFAVSVPFECLVEILARAIYATHNTLEPLASVAAGFAAGVGTTMTLSSSIGLAALPAGYVAFQAVRVAVLAVFLRLRMARIGGASAEYPASARVTWEAPAWAAGAATGAAAATGAGRPNLPARPNRPARRAALLAIVVVAISAGTVLAGAQVLSQVSIAGDPQITPWARAGGTRPPVVAIDGSPSADPSPALPAAASSSADSTFAIGTLTPTASATPGIFVMDLYQPGDFTSEFLDTWCVPAAMQTSMNIMSYVPDTTRDTQAKLYDLAASYGGAYYGGADPEGWAKGLAALGYGNYQVGARAKMADALQIVVKQIRLTGRPAGLVVWKGWHSWVVSGFTATADPARTDNFTIISLRIEDVWYPRVSKLWPKSRPPDSDVPVGALGTDYVPWHQGKIYVGREGEYVYVLPVK